ncbi:MFS transporter [Klebsiella variicola]|uniref:MFS transporter n=1 Tax=Klebsiella variicola TaxID=244366 RepID=UPI0011ECFCB2|nr:MFS transporter [Klebsiella variicola]KAA0474739.1 MFS transporter [Klebsiella variicola]
MSESVHTNPSLYSKGMLAVICAQFLSAFGDNALLFATLALMKQLYYPEWSQPVLQMLFVGAYILFAPFVGQFADSFAKGRVMMVANGLKLLGAGCICFGVNPFIGYTLVGIGAAAYSPAKYGILGELTTGDKLVKANGLMESSTIAAILLGSMAGGILADWHVLAALIVCALVYGGAVVANLWIPKLPAFGLLLLLGVFGGFFIVPLNALLQERGKHSVGAGNAIAVQNLGENVAMLLMLGLYSLAVSVGVPPVAVGIGFGAVFAVAIAALWVWGRRK